MLSLITRIPLGYSEVIYNNRRYLVTRQDFNDGKSIKVYASEAGGTDFISFNYYITSQGESVKPCEMPAEKVLHFLQNFVLQ